MNANEPFGTFGTPKNAVTQVLCRREPGRVVFAPNYWQWFTHHLNHGKLPQELCGIGSQLEMIRLLGQDVFSRNVYCDPTQCWFGGLSHEVYDGVEVDIRRWTEKRDLVTEKTYRTKAGVLTERLRFVFSESTLVQEKFLLDDYSSQLDPFEEIVRARRWRFDRAAYERWQREVGEDGLIHPGELFSPLKLLHMAAGQSESVFLLVDHPERCRDWLALHEAAQLDLVRQMIEAKVPSMIAMDNLDAAFHTPDYIERYSASFYEKASQLCRAGGSAFFIHACGRQRAILPLVASLGVDGLEGVAFPRLGDVELDEAFGLSGERLLITGGISAAETEGFQSYEEVRRYLEGLLERLRPYSNRFMLSASCNTSVRTKWEVIQWFRDAWKELGR